MRTELQQYNDQNQLAMWAARVAECRRSNLPVKKWCKENGICEQTYFRWQKRVFEMAKAESEVQFAEVTPATVSPMVSNISVTVRIGGMEADIHSGADSSTIATVLQILKSC